MVLEPPDRDQRVTGGVDPDGWYDTVSQLPGPAFWAVVLATESARSARYRRPTTVLLVEAAGFDEIVSLWGHEVAHKAVADVGAILRTGCRASDYVARLGDSRFGLILTETDEIAAINMVERVRDRCDRILGARAEEGRVGFGWASASMAMKLAEAVGTAEERLRHEIEQG